MAEPAIISGMKKLEEYHGYSGLYSLSIELEQITIRIEEHGDKEAIKRLQELSANLKVLSKEWQFSSSPKRQDSSALKPAVNPTFPRNREKL